MLEKERMHSICRAYGLDKKHADYLVDKVRGCQTLYLHELGPSMRRYRDRCTLATLECAALMENMLGEALYNLRPYARGKAAERLVGKLAAAGWNIVFVEDENYD